MFGGIAKIKCKLEQKKSVVYFNNRFLNMINQNQPVFRFSTIG